MAIWPTSVATDADLYVAKNSLQTTLATALGTSDVTVVLASATGFPVAGAVTIDNEVIFYTNISGSSLTGCTRGADGTTAATHSVGVPVGAAIVAFHHNGLMAEIEAIETSLNLTASRAVVTSASGRVAVSAVLASELAFLAGVTSAIQTQIDAKAPTASPTFTGTVTIPTPFTLGAVSVTATGTEINRLAGVTSAVQTQLDAKAPLASPTFSGTAVIPTLDVTTISHTGGTAIKGSNSNNAASAGDRGEVISSSVADTSAVSSTGSSQYFDITSISLTAGSWLLFPRYGWTANGATITDLRFGVSSTSGNSSTGMTFGDNLFGTPTFPNASSDSSNSFSGYLVRLTGTTIYYLKARMTFSVATPKGYGTLLAIRII